MLQDSLLILETSLKKFNIDDEKRILVVGFFSHYKAGTWIYPGVIKRKFSIPIQDVYGILNELEINGVVESYFEVCCKRCKKTLGNVYQTFEEIPSTAECDCCGVVNALQNAYIIYKVIV